MNPLISIVIPTKNGLRVIERCISSIKKQNYKNYEVIVIDNLSNDGTPEFVKKIMKNAKIIVSKEGLAENRNIGIRKAKGKYVLMMDDDAFISKEWISRMVKFMEENKNIALAGGKILFDDKRIFSAGCRISKLGNGYDIGYEESYDKYNNPERRHYLNTTTLIARKDLILKIGLFDKAFFFGCEDADLGWRCNIAGFDVMYFPEVISYHPPKNRKRKDPFWRTYLWRKNKVLSYLKNYQMSTILKLSPLLFGVFVYDLIFKQDRIETLKGYSWNLFNLKYIIAQRKKVKSFRNRSDKELFEILNWEFR
jgi:GT2 family glycosyltransferase